jgi:hypothetical protein
LLQVGRKQVHHRDPVFIEWRITIAVEVLDRLAYRSQVVEVLISKLKTLLDLFPHGACCGLQLGEASLAIDAEHDGLALDVSEVLNVVWINQQLHLHSLHNKPRLCNRHDQIGVFLYLVKDLASNKALNLIEAFVALRFKPTYGHGLFR